MGRKYGLYDLDKVLVDDGVSQESPLNLVYVLEQIRIFLIFGKIKISDRSNLNVVANICIIPILAI